MDALDSIAERKIREALERGEFERVPGSGEPLDLEDLSRVPEDLRAGYLLLKGAGVLPEEMALKKEVLRLDDLIAACHDDGELARLRKQRSAASLRFVMLMERRGIGPAHNEYLEKIAEKLARRSD